MDVNFLETLQESLATLPSWYLPVEIALCIFSIVCMWIIFNKAGEPGWKCLIPIYNTYTMFKIVYGNGWRFLLLLIPFANIIFMILLYVELSRSYGKSGVFAIGLIFLAPIFEAILAFDSSKYVGSKRDRMQRSSVAA